ncbi:MAG TPA: serine/threonine-protein kinase [Gaiellaceae bacterium]|nr:serine/threonine-protein kinase [Gaiellaceae bacterium]
MSSVAAALPRDELVLGRYRPVQPLGSGGSGSVWLARDEHEGDDVTLKIVAREGKAAQRAEREAEAANRLDHERCLKARDFGTDADHSYIAYEYVPGETFRHALRAGRMDDGTTVEAGAQILDGLAHAHDLGIVHRDIKPSNVLLADDDEGVSVRLLDFGLALFDEADTLTAAGDVPGTLAYISPERLKGHTAGPAADVWAVGVLLWEALAGFHPYWTSSMLDTAKKIQEAPPSLGTVRPDLPAALIEAVDRAMCRDPRKRPTATRMAASVRSAWRSRQRRRRSKKQRRNLRFRTPPFGRIAAVGLAAVASGWVAATLPFFPGSWALIVATLAAGLTLARDRAGLAFTLAVPVLPLGNVSMGLAVAYLVAAGAWLGLMWGEPRRGLLFAAGPLLAPVGMVGLLPLVALCIKNPVRRAATAGAGVLTAVAVAGIHGASLPFADEQAPSRLALGATDSPREAASVVVSTLQAQPVTLVAAGIAALAAAALPVAVRRGYAGIAGYGVAVVAVSLAAGVGMAVVPAVCATGLTCVALAAVRYLRESDVPLSQLLGSTRERLLGGLEPAPGRASAD